MTRRPDYADCTAGPYAVDRRLDPPALVPSPGWRPRWWQWPTWADLRLIWDYVLAQTEMITTMGAEVSESSDAIARLDEETNHVEDKLRQNAADIERLAEALANAQPGSDEAAALRQELAGVVSAVNAQADRLHGLAADPSNPVPDPAPADGGDTGGDTGGGDVPTGGGDAPVDGDPLDGNTQPVNEG